MKTLTVHVTQEHIDNGVRSESESCPIALALSARGISEPKVGLVSFSGYLNSECIHGDLPRPAREFILNFDDDIPVEPSIFRLPLD